MKTKSKTSKYKYGDKVLVAVGVNDPDFSIDIGGWSGEIDEIDLLDNGSWIYRIVWDKRTLSIAGDNYISKCENENLDYECIYLEENELELMKSNDCKQGGMFVA
jgi:hypothetical protein